jgi:hypothetical protein
MGTNIRPDIAAAESWSHPDCINSTAPTILVLRMVSLWDNGFHDSYEDNCLYHSALQSANYVLPWTLQAYLKWEFDNFKLSKDAYSVSRRELITQEVFDQARSFVRKCALEKWSAVYA